MFQNVCIEAMMGNTVLSHLSNICQKESTKLHVKLWVICEADSFSQISNTGKLDQEQERGLSQHVMCGLAENYLDKYLIYSANFCSTVNFSEP